MCLIPEIVPWYRSQNLSKSILFLRCFLIIFRFQFCPWVSRYNKKNESTLRKACSHLTQVKYPMQRRPLHLHKLRWLVLLLASSFFTAVDEGLKKQNNLSTVTKPGKGLGQPLNLARQAMPRESQSSLTPVWTGKQIYSPGPSQNGWGVVWSALICLVLSFMKPLINVYADRYPSQASECDGSMMCLLDSFQVCLLYLSLLFINATKECF